MNREVPPSVEELFRHLANGWAAAVSPPEYGGSFDDAFQVADVGDVRLRFVRDRGSESLEVGCGAEWFSVELLRLVLHGGEPGDAPPDLRNDAAFLREHLADIQELFSPAARSDTLRQLAALRSRKIRRMFPDSFADTGAS